MKQIRRYLAVAVCLAAVTACSGSERLSPAETDPADRPEIRIAIRPDPAVVVRGSSVMVRVDLVGADDQPSAAYEIDFDELWSSLDIRTAPCPAELGRPACQDWSIQPAARSAPGHYRVGVRSVGLPGAPARSSFVLHVVAEQPARAGTPEETRARL